MRRIIYETEVSFLNTLAVLALGIVLPVSAANICPSMHRILDGKVKRLEAPMGNAEPMRGPPLGVQIVYPEDGITLQQGSYTVLVSANAKGGITKVELKIEGPESIGWTDITENFDGTYYTYGWTVSTDGTYYLTARITDSRGKTKQNTNTVYIGAPQPERWAVVIGMHACRLDSFRVR